MTFSFTDDEGRLRPILRFLLAVVVTYAAVVIGAVLLTVVSSSHGRLNDMWFRLAVALLLVGGYSLLAWFADGSDRPLDYIGLPLNWRAVRDTLLGFALGAALVTLAVAAIAVFGKLEMKANVSGATLGRAAIVVALLIAGAMCEELVFRGYPFHRLAESAGVPGALAVLAILFGAVHLSNPNSGGILSWAMLCTVLVGVLFAYAYLRTRALWLPFGMHLGWNLMLGMVFGLPVSGLSDFAVVVRGRASGSVMLTGGTYGIENSLTGAVVIALGFLLVRMVPAGKATEVCSSPVESEHLTS